VIGAANGAGGAAKNSVGSDGGDRAEDYATAATIAKHGAETRIFASLPVIDHERFIREKGPSNCLQQALSKWKSRGDASAWIRRDIVKSCVFGAGASLLK
jgi:hypothetical protein